MAGKRKEQKTVVAENGPFKVLVDSDGFYRFEVDDKLEGITPKHLTMLIQALLEALKNVGSAQFMDYTDG